MEHITFKLAAYSAAAGKYDPQAPNMGNEDNFYVDDNLADDATRRLMQDEIVELSDCGMLMVVADGMGGMNAGEVASEIAIKTVMERFAPGCVTPQMAQDKSSRRNYMEATIEAADRNIKEQARKNPEQRGMGSTIIMAWLVGDQLTVSWCGDSRCYRYSPKRGIEMLSHDHSYVQELADKGIITYEQTFGHPQGNIVTRSLGDESRKAQPETKDYMVYQDDIIMLCSDGLSGVLFDRKEYIDNSLISNENLEDIIRNNQHSMVACREALFAAAERADWYDNVTVVLCRICSGGNLQSDLEMGNTHDDVNNGKPGKIGGSMITINLNKKVLIWLVVVVAILLAAGCLWLKWKHDPVDEGGKEAIEVNECPIADGKIIGETDGLESDRKASKNPREMKEEPKTNEEELKGQKKLDLEKVNAGDSGSIGRAFNELAPVYDTIKYIVKKDDTLLKIARDYNIIPKDSQSITKDKLGRFLGKDMKPWIDSNKDTSLKEGDVIYLLVPKMK